MKDMKMIGMGHSDKNCLLLFPKCSKSTCPSLKHHYLMCNIDKIHSGKAGLKLTVYQSEKVYC